MPTVILAVSLIVAGALFAIRQEHAKVERDGLLARERQSRHESKRLALDNARLVDEAETARAAAQVATRARDEFLATLSHELRTPLNAIFGWLRILASGRADAATTARAVAALQRNARAQAQIVDDLLDLSDITTGKLRLDVRPMNVVAIIESALDVVRAAAAAKGIRLQAELDPRTGAMTGDPERLRQVAWNLLANAVKFTPPLGCVEVRLQRSCSHVEITVGDTGQGIDPDVLPHLFGRFHQADSSTTRAYGGVGIGLALVRHLVELHGGTVEAASPGAGRGATFAVKLPIQGQTESSPTDEGRPPVAA